MRSILRFLSSSSIVCTIALLASSCTTTSNPTSNNNNTNPNIPVAPEGTVLATFGTTTFQSDTGISGMFSGVTSAIILTSDQRTSIAAWKKTPNDTLYMALSLKQIGLGTTQLSVGETGGNYLEYHNKYGWATTAAPDVGSVTITKYDTTNHLISGTFSFVATDPSATNLNVLGSFNDLHLFIF